MWGPGQTSSALLKYLTMFPNETTTKGKNSPCPCPMRQCPMNLLSQRSRLKLYWMEEPARTPGNGEFSLRNTVNTVAITVCGASWVPDLLG